MPLLPPAIVATHRAHIRLNGATLTVETPDASPSVIPLGLIGSLIIIGRSIECSTSAQLALAERGLATVFVGCSGHVRMISLPTFATTDGVLELRIAQYALEAQRSASDCAARPLALMSTIIDQKLQAIAALLAQHDRTHDDIDLTVPRARLDELRARAANSGSLAQLRGYEGAASALYWQVIPALFRGELTTSHRSRQPPQDECNAALSFGYGILLGEMCGCVAAYGLEPMLGFLHPPAANRPSLALDLLEPFRHAIIDRLVLRATNRRELVAAHFESRDGGVFLNADGRRVFLRLYAQAMASATAPSPETPQRALRDLLAVSVADFAQSLTRDVTTSVALPAVGCAESRISNTRSHDAIQL